MVRRVQSQLLPRPESSQLLTTHPIKLPLTQAPDQLWFITWAPDCQRALLLGAHGYRVENTEGLEEVAPQDLLPFLSSWVT